MMLFLMLLKGFVIFGLAFLSARYLQRRSADFRTRIWTVTFTGLFIIASLPFLLPDVSIPVWTVSGEQTHAVQAARFDESATSGAHSPAIRGEALLTGSRSIPLASLATWVWRIGVAFFLSWLAFQFIWLELKRRRATRCPDSIQVIATQCGQKLGLRTLPDIYVSSEVRVPLVFLGLRGMNVLLPVRVANMSESRLESVLLHELVHVQRHDVLISILSSVVCALYWVVPFAWWSAARAQVAREEACDQQVLATGVDRYRYADDLLESAREIGIAGHSCNPVPISSAMASANCLRQRIENLLRGDTGQYTSQKTRHIFALALLASLPVAFSQVCYSVPAPEVDADRIELTPATNQPGYLHPAPGPDGPIAHRDKIILTTR